MQKEKWINRILVMVGVCAVLAVAAVFILKGSGGRQMQFITYATLEPTAEPGAFPEETAEPEEDAEEEPYNEPLPEATSLAEAYPGLRSCTISAAGNVIVSREIMETAKKGEKYDFRDSFGFIRPYIERSDFALCTVTGPMGGEGTLGYSDYPQYNTPEAMIDAVKDAGIDLLALSNRHSLDTLFDGFKSQINNLNKKKLGYFGGAASQEEHDTPVIRTAGGITVGFLNYTDSLSGMQAYSEHAATEYGVNLLSEANVKNDVKKLHAAGADVVAAYVLWGDADSDTYNAEQKKICKQMANAGVDLIFGAGPGSVQPIFRVSGKGKTGSCVCACSLGNFLSSDRPGEDGQNAHADSGILLSVTLQETDLGKIEIPEVRYLPTYIWQDGNTSEYRVLCAADALETMPQGMSEEAYQRMNEAYQEVLFITANGIGVNDVSER